MGQAMRTKSAEVGLSWAKLVAFWLGRLASFNDRD